MDRTVPILYAGNGENDKAGASASNDDTDIDGTRGDLHLPDFRVGKRGRQG